MGLEGISPFSAFFFFLRAFLRFFGGNLPFFRFFKAFLRFVLEQGANNCNSLEMGNFTPTPSAPTPLRTS